MSKHIVLIATLDTKGREAGFLRQCIEQQGWPVIVVDAGILGEAQSSAEIPATDVACAAGATLAALREAKDSGAAVATMKDVIVRHGRGE